MKITQEQVNPQVITARLARARSAIGHGILYNLGSGGTNPAATLPSDGSGKCDCSGFLSWTVPMDRQQENLNKPWSKTIPWISTAAIVADVTGDQELFVQVAHPFPGCYVAYSAEPEGHCAVVTHVETNAAGETTELTVVDCHGGYSGHHVAAITENEADYFFRQPTHVYFTLKQDLIANVA